jgi:precorrin-2 dehydrogenase/sirohydrochlorin ferrochelatase
MEGVAPSYPVALAIAGRPCLVVGGGKVAARKIAGLLSCGAAVTVVAPQVHEAVALLAGDGAFDRLCGRPLDVQVRPYEKGEAAAYRLVIAATGVKEVDSAVHADAEAAGVWVNSADDPDNSTFILPAVFRDGPVSVSVSTSGKSPALAVWLRDRVAEGIGENLGPLAELLGEARRRLHDEGRRTDSVDWKALLGGELGELVAEGDLAGARALLERIIERGEK